MKKGTSITMLAVCLVCLAIAGCKSGKNNREEIQPTELQKKIAGVYVPLFSDQGVNASKWDKLWLEETAKYTGKENAPAAVEKLKSSTAGTVIGKEAVGRFGDHPNSDMDFSTPFQFDCSFKQGVAKFIFDGRNIKGINAGGKEVFSHDYTEIGYDKDTDTHKYKSDDGNMDEFAYFFFRSDSPSDTYHLEFRYGSDPEALAGLRTGRYAYWMAAAVREGNNADCEEAVRLFVKENLSKEKE